MVGLLGPVSPDGVTKPARMDESHTSIRSVDLYQRIHLGYLPSGIPCIVLNRHDT